MSAITDVKEVTEKTDMSDVNAMLKEGWILLAVLQNTGATEWHVIYVMGKP